MAATEGGGDSPDDGIITTDFMEYAAVAPPPDSVASSGYGVRAASRPQHTPPPAPAFELELSSSRTGRLMREKSAGTGLGKRLVPKKEFQFQPPSFAPDTNTGIGQRALALRGKSPGTGLGKRLVPQKEHPFVPPSFTPETGLGTSKKAAELNAKAMPRIYSATDKAAAQGKARKEAQGGSPKQGPFGPPRHTLAADRSTEAAEAPEAPLDFVSDGQFPVAETVGERSKLAAKLAKTARSHYVAGYKPDKGARPPPRPADSEAVSPAWHRGRADKEDVARATARVESPEFRKSPKKYEALASRYKKGYKPPVATDAPRPKSAPVTWSTGRSEYTRRRREFGAFETADEQGRASGMASVAAAKARVASSGYGKTWTPPVVLRPEQYAEQPSSHWPRASDVESEGGYGETVDLADAADFERLLRHTATDQGIAAKPWWQEEEEEESEGEDAEHGTVTTFL